MKKETCWQAILRVMGDGKERRYAQVADLTGFQVNTVERYCHEINSGKHGRYRIESRPEPGRSTSLARLVVESDTREVFVRKCRKTLNGYPEDHVERRKYEELLVA